MKKIINDIEYKTKKRISSHLAMHPELGLVQCNVKRAILGQDEKTLFLRALKVT
jgi:hypothetical protein